MWCFMCIKGQHCSSAPDSSNALSQHSNYTASISHFHTSINMTKIAVFALALALVAVSVSEASCYSKCRFFFCDYRTSFKVGVKNDFPFTGPICKKDGTRIGHVDSTGEAYVYRYYKFIRISKWHPYGLKQKFSPSFFKSYTIRQYRGKKLYLSGIGHETPQQNQAHSWTASDSSFHSQRIRCSTSMGTWWRMCILVDIRSVTVSRFKLVPSNLLGLSTTFESNFWWRYRRHLRYLCHVFIYGKFEQFCSKVLYSAQPYPLNLQVWRQSEIISMKYLSVETIAECYKIHHLEVRIFLMRTIHGTTHHCHESTSTGSRQRQKSDISYWLRCYLKTHSQFSWRWRSCFVRR